MASHSPNWKPVAGTIKLKKKKNKAISRTVGAVEPSNGKHDVKSITSSPGQKRRNPFSQNSNSGKKRKDQQDTVLNMAISNRTEKQNTENLNDFFSSLTEAPDAHLKTDINDQLPSVQEVIQKEDNKVESAPEDSQAWHDGYPTDWCLRTRCRFISPKPFSWCCPLRTAEQVSGLLAFAKTNFENAETGVVPIISKEKTDKTAFSQLCHYWQHPCLPWMKLFPRYIADPSKGNVGGNNLDEDMKQSLYQNWAESFTSAFNMVKSGGSPFLYMCAHQMTVIFRSVSRKQQSYTEALVTPTTKGFREALKNEGVDFTMPLCGGKQTSAEELDELGEDEDVQQTVEAKVDELDEQEEESENHSDWIQTMGLNHSDFPELQPRKLKPQENTHRDIDRRAESVIHVVGPNTQALFNYLLNCKSCIALTGKHAGVPPTLLSPIAFKGATLQTLQIRQGTLRTEGTSDKEYSLEVCGPILPSTVYGLVQLFQRTQKEFSISFSNHDTTSPFNCNTEVSSDNNDTEDSACVECVTTQEWLHQSSSLNKHAIKLLGCKDTKFTWTL